MRKGEDHDVVVEKIINLYRQLKNTIYLACKIKHFLFLIFQRPYTYMYIIKWINRMYTEIACIYYCTKLYTSISEAVNIKLPAKSWLAFVPPPR